MRNIKEIYIKNRTCYFFHDMNDIENFNSDLREIDKMSYKNIGIYYIGYVTIKDSKHVNILRVNPLYIINGEVDGSIEEKIANTYLTFADTDKNKKVLEKYTKLWNNIKSLIKKKDKPGEYEKDYMKIKFNSSDNLSLNKILKLRNLTVIVRSVFEENDKYYP